MSDNSLTRSSLKDEVLGEADISHLDDFDYLRFTFSDMHGIGRSRTIPKEHAKEFVKTGVAVFSGSVAFGPTSEIPTGIRETKETNFSNMQVRPMPGTLHELSWATREGKPKIGEFLCETFWLKPYRNGSHQEACPRYVARKQLCRLQNMGYQLYSSFEAEFYVFEKDGVTPIFKGVDMCSNILMNELGSYMYDMERKLRQGGVDVVAMNTEYGPGQIEIALQPTFGITGADRMFSFKDGAKAINYHADRRAIFMTKPNPDSLASGMHYNHSLWSISSPFTNVFHDPLKSDGFSDVAKYWIAGLVKHATALTALFCPTLNCYRRLHSPFAPSKASWGIENRKCAFRAKSSGSSETYVENRLPSSSANPYLVLAGTVAAGIDGILNRLECPPEEADSASMLPKSLEECLIALEENEIMKEALGEEFIRWFTVIKKEFEIDKTKNVPFDSQEARDKEKELYFYSM